MKARSTSTIYKYILILLMCQPVLVHAQSTGQDTTRISFEDFLTKALDNSGQVDYQSQDVRLAENRIDQAQAQRYLPNLEFNSQHGLVPGVESDSLLPGGRPLPRDEYYLDPNLRNDWSNWAVFTKFSVQAVQPVFTWGAINKAVEAARLGAKAAGYKFESDQNKLRERLFDLYFSYVLALEIERILNEAEDKIEEIDGKIEEMQEDGDDSLDESEVFKFKIFKSEFDIQKAEVNQNLQFVKETWKYVLRNEENITYEPEIRFLDPVTKEISELSYYQNSAFNNRPELKALEYTIQATDTYINSLRRKNLPGLYLGGYINFANTPNRPRQDNPFIINNTNYFNGGFGFTIRQDLSIFSIKANIERSRIELNKVNYAKMAAKDGILLEVNDRYRQAAVADVKVNKTDEALVTSKEWLRLEQLDYDFGIGEVKDLIDAMKKEFELKFQLKQAIFEFNSSLAKLNNSAGLPLTTFITN